MEKVKVQAVQTRICGYCGTRTTSPCGSRQEADSCGAMMQHLENVANTQHHPLRVKASVALVLQDFEDYLEAKVMAQ